MIDIRQDRFYNEDHIWVLANNIDNTYTLGISDYAQDSLGDIVFVELPKVKTKFEAGDEICLIESVKTASTIKAPVNLKVIAVNELLNDEPELINDSCYDNGWLIKFTAANIDKLMPASVYINIKN